MLHHTKLTVELEAKLIWFYHSDESSAAEVGRSRMFEGFEYLLLIVFGRSFFFLSCFVTLCSLPTNKNKQRMISASRDSVSRKFIGNFEQNIIIETIRNVQCPGFH